MIATLLLVGGPDPADTDHLHDVRQDLAYLSDGYSIVLAEDVDTARAWCESNPDPVVIAYTAPYAEAWQGETAPLGKYGTEVVVIHGAPDLHLLTVSEDLEIGLPLPLDQPTGRDQLHKRLATATTTRG